MLQPVNSCAMQALMCCAVLSDFYTGRHCVLPERTVLSHARLYCAVLCYAELHTQATLGLC